jgi:hypothetical protein
MRLRSFWSAVVLAPLWYTFTLRISPVRKRRQAAALQKETPLVFPYESVYSPMAKP